MRARSLTAARHSALPNTLTRSRSATIGSREPFATMGSMVPRQWHKPSQAPGRLTPHWCMRKALERRTT